VCAGCLLLHQVDNAAYDTAYAAVQDVLMPEPDMYEALAGPSLKLALQDIQIGDTELGRGHYGVVFKGALAVARDGAPAPNVIYSRGAGREVSVAIKTLPDDKADERSVRDDLWEEIKIMCKIQSKGGDPNVVRFHGYAGRPEATGPLLLVLELAGNGSLLGHLKKQREGRDVALPLLPQLLQRFATEVASGMCFVAKVGMVHRDLAARNILLDAQMRCKITDFGLTRNLYSEAQYTANTGDTASNPTAWAWTSLEGLTDGEFTTKGDVWSYGIVLTELCSLGQKPYLQFHAPSRDFLEYLQDGKRVEFSRRWPKYLCRLMAQCWCGDPRKRPSFPAIVAKLASGAGGNGGTGSGGRGRLNETSGAAVEHALDAELLSFLDERGLLDTCKAVLEEHEVDSLESLRELTEQDMLGMGLQADTIAKLQHRASPAPENGFGLAVGLLVSAGARQGAATSATGAADSATPNHARRHGQRRRALAGESTGQARDATGASGAGVRPLPAHFTCPRCSKRVANAFAARHGLLCAGAAETGAGAGGSGDTGQDDQGYEIPQGTTA